MAWQVLPRSDQEVGARCGQVHRVSLEEKHMSPWSNRRGRRVCGAVATAVLALAACPGCGSQRPAEGDRSEAGGDPRAQTDVIRVRYVQTFPQDEQWRADIDVVTGGDRRVRVTYTVPVDVPVTIYRWVWDGRRILEFGDDAEGTYTLHEHPPVEGGLVAFMTRWIVTPGSKEFAKECRGGHPLDTSMTIAGRDAVGYQCGADRRHATMWLDKETHLLLRLTGVSDESYDDGVLVAEEVTLDPPIKDSTFSTDPPRGAEVQLSK
jgi:hypothetical protein